METFSVAVIVGSLRHESSNRRLADALARLAPANLLFEQIDIGNLPLFNQDAERTDCPPVSHFRAAVQHAHAVVFVTPEYNRSIPGPLKNAIDQGSRPAGQSIWAGKPAGILGISPGPLGTAPAQQHLRNVLACLDMQTMAQPDVYLQYKEAMFSIDGQIGDSARPLLERWMAGFARWVAWHSHSHSDCVQAEQ